MNKKQKKNNELQCKEEEENVAEISSCYSLSEGEKEYKNIPKKNVKNKANYIKPNDQIKNEPNENTSYYNIFNNKIKDYNDDYNSPYRKNDNNDNNCPKNTINNNNNNIYTPSKGNNTVLNNLSIKENGSSFFDYSFDNSFPIEYEEKLQIKEERSYFSKISKYIKYHPIDQFLPSIPFLDSKNKKKRSKTVNTFNFNKRDIMHIDSDNDITDITSYNNENYENEILPILTIPRIRPIKEEHSKAIKKKLERDGIKIYQTDNEIIKNEEQKLYVGSFILYDVKNDIRVHVPCYRDNEKMKEFMKKKKLEVVEFQEDNDIDTDDEQLQLEIERNNEALINFMKKIEQDKDYIENNLQRK